jgi:DNA-binding SARP family transcriptional activator
VDALRFGRLLDAVGADDPGARRFRLTEALQLWRGEPFEDLRSPWLQLTEAPRLVDRYLVAIEDRVDLDLASGRHGGLTAELRELTARHPLRESLSARLLLVRAGCGRPAEALARYEMIRTPLADELTGMTVSRAPTTSPVPTSRSGHP